MTLDLKDLYAISSMKLLLWDRDSRYYRYKVEASGNNTTWVTIVDRTATTNQCRSWQKSVQPGDPGTVLAADRHIQQYFGQQRDSMWWNGRRTAQSRLVLAMREQLQRLPHFIPVRHLRHGSGQAETTRMNIRRII